MSQGWRPKTGEPAAIMWTFGDDLCAGWLREYPDHRTQGGTVDVLKKHLQDTYSELASGQLPCGHKAGESRVA